LEEGFKAKLKVWVKGIRQFYFSSQHLPNVSTSSLDINWDPIPPNMSMAGNIFASVFGQVLALNVA